MMDDSSSRPFRYGRIKKSDGEETSQPLEDDNPYHMDNPIHNGPPQGGGGVGGLVVLAKATPTLGNK